MKKTSSLLVLAACGLATQAIAQTTKSPYDYDWGESAVRKMYGEQIPDASLSSSNTVSSRIRVHRLAGAHGRHKDSGLDAPGSSDAHTQFGGIGSDTPAQDSGLAGDAHSQVDGFDSAYPDLGAKKKNKQPF